MTAIGFEPRWISAGTETPIAPSNTSIEDALYAGICAALQQHPINRRDVTPAFDLPAGRSELNRREPTLRDEDSLRQDDLLRNQNSVRDHDALSNHPLGHDLPSEPLIDEGPPITDDLAAAVALRLSPCDAAPPPAEEDAAVPRPDPEGGLRTTPDTAPASDGSAEWGHGFWEQVAALHADRAATTPERAVDIFDTLREVAAHRTRDRSQPADTRSQATSTAETAHQSHDIIAALEALFFPVAAPPPARPAAGTQASTASAPRSNSNSDVLCVAAERAVFTVLTLRDALLLGANGRRG